MIPGQGFGVPEQGGPGEGMEMIPEVAVEEAIEAPVVTLSREAMLAELLAWCNSFVERSSEWRRSSFEEQWRRWQRNADSIYDPAISAKKEKWQSRAVVPITASHRENAQAQLFKTEITPNPPLEFSHRIEKPQPQMAGMPTPVNQGELIRDLVLWEREKARYATRRNEQLEDKTTYGSGFMRIRFETKYEDREVTVPDFEKPSVFNPPSLIRAMQGQPLQVGEHKEIKPVVTYRGARIEHLSIWDVFPDPLALQIKGHAIAHRYRLTYGDIVEGAEQGYYLPESVLALKDIGSDDIIPQDKKQVESDRGIAESNINRTAYQKNLTCYQIQAKLPAKWVLIDGQDILDPEKLIPARISFHKGAVIAVELSDTYDGEPDIYKDDYMPVAGQFYGRGIPEMLKDVQMVANEAVNQRLDSAAIVLDPMFFVLSKFVEFPEDLNQSRAGGLVRIKIPTGSNISDIRAVAMRMDKGTIDRSAFIEPQEWERYAHERTSITQTSLGTESNSDTTLGGQQIQQGVTGDKLAYIGMLSEYNFQDEFNHGLWALIYKNYNPEDYAMALGMEKAAQLQLMTPEQVALNFRLVPKGIFEAQRKGQRQAQVMALTQAYEKYPWFNAVGSARVAVATADQQEHDFILPEAEAVQITQKAEMMAQGMAEQLVSQRDAEEDAKEKGVPK